VACYGFVLSLQWDLETLKQDVVLQIDAGKEAASPAAAFTLPLGSL
jgi:hypothetical protein